MMKPKSTARLSFPLATALAAAFATLSTPCAKAAAYRWVGGGGNSAWSGANWSLNGINPAATATFDSTTDLVYGSVGPTTFLGTASTTYTINSLAFDGDSTTAGRIRFNSTGASSGGSSRHLRFEGTGMGITLTSGMTGNMDLGSAAAAVFGNMELNGNMTITNDSTGGGTLTISAPIIDVGSARSITKDGVGLVTLTKANTYSGTTTITAGTLALDATGTISNSAVVLGGGTFDVSAKGGSGYDAANLSGKGSVAGTINVTTQLVMGGAAGAGTINFANLALTSGTTAVFDLTGGVIPGAGDLGDVSGTLNLASATLNLEQLGSYTAGNKFTLFAYDGLLSNTFSGLTDGATFIDAGGLWQIDYNDTTAGSNGGSGALYVTVTAVPEPGAALLGGLGFLMLLRRRR